MELHVSMRQIAQKDPPVRLDGEVKIDRIHIVPGRSRLVLLLYLAVTKGGVIQSLVVRIPKGDLKLSWSRWRAYDDQSRIPRMTSRFVVRSCQALYRLEPITFHRAGRP